MMHSTFQKNRRRRGSALVEGSLIFVLALGLLICLIDIGQIMFIHQTVTDRVRSAARWAAVNAYDATQITNMVLYNSTTAPQGGAGALFGMTSSNVAVAHDTSDGLYADRIQITVSGYSYMFFSGAIINGFYNSSGASAPSATRTGLTVEMTIPHEVVN
jgi:Flp pilus assembly protein TadG